MSTSLHLPDGVITIGSAEVFNKLVHGFRDHLLIVTFSTLHCGACKAFNPIYERVQQEMKEQNILFTKVDAEEQREISEQFSIMGTPSTLFIFRQKVKKRKVGLIPKGDLQQIIKELLTEIANISD